MTQRERQLLRWIEEDPMISQQDLADKAGITRSSVAVHISNLMKKGYIAGKGYIVRSAPYAVVIGGVNMDIGGRSLSPLVEKDSNPGTVQISLGGVGRNIAHNMSLLGMNVHLVTAFGDDLASHKITASCSELGIDISHALQVAGTATSTYLFIAGPDGNMELALSDMSIYEHITPSFLSSRLPFLNNAQLIVIDTNLPEKTIEWIAENCRVPIFADPVSATKAGKLHGVLNRIHTLSANRLEAEKLSGIPLTSRNNLERAADVLLANGLQRIFITLGADGVFAADRHSRCLLPSLPGKPVNTTGCGDAFMAAVAWAYPEGTSLENTARAGLAAAAITMESEETINPLLCAAQVQQRSAAARVQFKYPR